MESAIVVHNNIMCYARKPCVEFPGRFVFIALQLENHLHEGVLEDIHSEVVVSHHEKYIRHQFLLVSAQQLVKRRVVAVDIGDSKLFLAHDIMIGVARNYSIQQLYLTISRAYNIIHISFRFRVELFDRQKYLLIKRRECIKPLQNYTFSHKRQSL